MKEKSPKPKKVTKKEAKSNENRLKNTADLLGISEYHNGYFVRWNGELMDIFQLLGSNVRSANPAEVTALIENHARYYRMQTKNIKIITLNYPTNTKEQREHLKWFLDRSADPIHKEMLTDEIRVLEYLEEYRTETANFLFLFGTTEADLSAQRQLLLSSNILTVRQLEPEKKITLLKKLCNMNDDVKL